MTKLEELKSARDAAYAAYEAAWAATHDVDEAYQAELNKTKETNQ